MKNRQILTALTFLLLPAAAVAQDDLARATALRDSASQLWNQREFARASEQLQQAFAIYGRLDGDHLRDRAVVCRAIVWNEAEGGDRAATLRWFTQLVELLPAPAKGAPTDTDLASGYSAVYTIAARAEPITTGVELLRAARRLVQDKHLLLAAQVQHDLGTLSFQAGDLAGMRAALDLAIAERKKLGDAAGLGWSWNNRANYELASDHVDEAAAPLLRLQELHARGEALATQQAAAFNLGTLFAKALATPPATATIETLWSLAKVACESRQPFVMPPDRIVREVMAIDARRRGAAGAAATAKRALALLQRVDWPREMRADLELRIAQLALTGDAASARIAQDVLARADVGSGPCSAHLAARRDALLALVAARRKARGYETMAPQAAAAMAALGDRAAQLQLLELLTTDRDVAATDATRGKLAEQLAAVRQSGGPGGDGATAMSQGAGEVPADADDHTTFFEVLLPDPAKPQLVDRIGGGRRELDVRWKPHNLSFNGCGLGLHGGYLVVRSMQYGTGASASGGAPGQATLDELGNYVPLSADGDWQITRNGALRFARHGAAQR